MQTDDNHTESGNESNYAEAAADRLEDDTIDADAHQARAIRTVQKFDDAEVLERRDLADRPTGTLTPSGRYHAAGETDDEWITSRWAIGQEEAR